MWQNTFDSTSALSGMFLWLIFGYLAGLLNCDLQRFLAQHPLVIHLFGIVSFFFLFTIIDTNNKTNIALVWLKTLFIYVLFVLMTKSKWYFVIPVLALLLVDQTFKKHVAIQKERNKDITQLQTKQEYLTKILNIFVISIIIFGTLHYMLLQKIEYKKNFSFYKFFFGVSKCKSYAPQYH